MAQEHSNGRPLKQGAPGTFQRPTPLKIGLYNRWVRTAGGGEKHSLAIAEILRGQADVELLTHDRVDLAAVADRLRLRLDRVRVRYVETNDDAVTKASSDYDIFINATYMSLAPSRAAQSVLLVFFPNQLFPSRWSMKKAWLVERFSRHLAFPRYLEGFAPPEATGRRLARWTDGHGRLSIAVPERGEPWIDFVLRARNERLPVTIRCAGNVVATTHEVLVGRDFATYRVPLAPALSGEIEVEIFSPTLDMRIATETSREQRTAGVCVLEVHVPGLRHRIYRGLFEWLFPARRYALEHQHARYKAWRALRSYSAIWANSQFTQRWVKRYWGRDAEVLYPPVDVDQLRPDEKHPLILSVGRFFRGGHSKRQDVLIEAVRALDSHLPSGWHVVLAGGVGQRAEDRDYYHELHRAAEGLPISFRGDVSIQELAQLYGNAAIYWHAAGFNDDKRPDPATFEHFGITTVEAMSAGCVPLVYDCGGQAEIVHPGVDGHRWRTLPELVALTRTLVADPARREHMSKAALASAKRFTRQNFDERAAALLRQLSERL